MTESEYGPWANIVGLAGSLVAATGAFAMGFRGRAKWEPSEEDVPRGPQKVGSVVSAVLIGALWLLKQKSSDMHWLIWCGISLVAGTILAVLIYGFLIGAYTYIRKIVKNDKSRQEMVIGGFCLTPAAHARHVQQDVTIQKLFEDSAYDPDMVWTRPSRVLCRQAFVMSYLILSICGTVALASICIAVGLPKPPHVFQTHVEDTTTSLALEGVEVGVRGPDLDNSYATGSDGNCRFASSSEVNPIKFEFTLAKDGYESLILSRTIPNIEPPELISFKLRKQAATQSTLPPPSKPTGLVATAGNASILLKWTPDADSKGFNIKRQMPGGSFQTVALGVTQPSWTDVDVKNGTDYKYVVIAQRDGQESQDSAEISATPSAPTTTPEVMLASASVQFHTNNEDKDHDTRLSVQLQDASGKVLGSLNGTFGRFPDDTDSSVLALSLSGSIKKSEVQRGKVVVGITPVGNDTWRFRFKVVLRFSDGSSLNKTWTAQQLTQSDREHSYEW